jgi:hypothetical protein
MALSHSPKIPINDLVVYLDSINSKSYSGSGTVWNNLTDTTNSTLENGASFDVDGIKFDGIDDFVDVGITASSLTIPFSMCAWFNATEIDVSDQGRYRIISRFTSAFGTRGAISINGSDVNLHTDGGTLRGATAIETNRWYFVAGVWLSGAWKFYVNDFEVKTGSNSTSSANGGVYIGRLEANRSFVGKISNVMIFNRELSDSDVREIYNALRGRYGI